MNGPKRVIAVHQLCRSPDDFGKNIRNCSTGLWPCTPRIQLRRCRMRIVIHHHRHDFRFTARTSRHILRIARISTRISGIGTRRIPLIHRLAVCQTSKEIQYGFMDDITRDARTRMVYRAWSSNSPQTFFFGVHIEYAALGILGRSIVMMCHRKHIGMRELQSPIEQARLS